MQSTYARPPVIRQTPDRCACKAPTPVLRAYGRPRTDAHAKHPRPSSGHTADPRQVRMQSMWVGLPCEGPDGWHGPWARADPTQMGMRAGPSTVHKLASGQHQHVHVLFCMRPCTVSSRLHCHVQLAPTHVRPDATCPTRPFVQVRHAPPVCR